MPDRLLIRITSEPIGADEAAAFVADPAAGGTCLFVGTVRDHSAAGGVTGLTYEAWEELAAKRLEEIGGEMLEEGPVRKGAPLHRTGDLAIGEASAVGACPAPPSADAATACRDAIESRKKRGLLLSA